jgi:hypothetical protein
MSGFKTILMINNADNPPIKWSLARRQEYFEWANRVIDQIPDPPSHLLSLFMAIYDRKP